MLVPRSTALARQAARPITRMMSTSAVRRAGDEGSTAGSQTFGDREKAQENAYIREREQAKLKELRKKIAEQKKHLEDIEKSLDDLK
ncbi:uncharacterized protein L969DRAFT_101159 [Mixia osmundae IAM 14324]|uniref:ATPase inhibitor, mitochondrial n=1 Tax=Mixia osmundae (strain CBS 9802 / IAM 14324 / JCM 22182 / KY 12970) TaxID=764103 RepID=G7DT70_MIXOS|nr:uncharacterized protein L969DRAFT_101159 [Mixia osmundae IAM 14324]KEI42717.1 hypothetical protein L969DRAFT_101159 [Mixia osmundae IAM 14324]GAA93949.1 hypothetical protein E5Q_00595 [Mixia osmundae IAM 14324]